jgi:multidrug efflux pump subunit AcrB
VFWFHNQLINTFALVLGGIVVDDAIVVVEAVQKWKPENTIPKSAHSAMGDISSAIIYYLCDVGGFIPVFY